MPEALAVGFSSAPVRSSQGKTSSRHVNWLEVVYCVAAICVHYTNRGGSHTKNVKK